MLYRDMPARFDQALFLGTEWLVLVRSVNGLSRQFINRTAAGQVQIAGSNCWLFQQYPHDAGLLATGLEFRRACPENAQPAMKSCSYICIYP